MNNKSITALVVMIIYLSSLFTPFAAFAADGAAAQAAAQAAANALSIAGEQSSPLSSQSNTGFGGDSDASTSENTKGEPPRSFPSLGDDASTEPAITVVNETAPQDKDKYPPETPAATAEADPAPRLDPREIDGSSMYNNLRGKLKRFGADFFSAPRNNTLTYAPVGPNYVVAQGGEAKLNI